MQATIPIWATDATRVEALGPPLVALLLSTLPPGDVLFIGNRSTVVDCISSHIRPPDIFLYHCTELCRDLLPHCLLLSAWIPHELNAHCNSLAHHARIDGLQLASDDLQHLLLQWIWNFTCLNCFTGWEAPDNPWGSESSAELP